jgi:5-methylcytosine-specific restriction protein B
MPDMTVFGHAAVGGSIPLGLWLAALNERLRADLGRDARNLQIGHAYLLENGQPITDFSRFTKILSEDLVPLLQEYCYEDYGALAKILGANLVDEGAQRIREELFQPAKKVELVQALLELSPEIVTTSGADGSAEDSAEDSESMEGEAPEA